MFRLKLYSRRLAVMLAMGAAIACRGGGGNAATPVPNPLAPGEVISIVLCGSTTENRSPCGDNTVNAIQFMVSGQNGSTCPCYRFSILNQSLTDLGSPGATYEFTGFRQGMYEVSGQAINGLVVFSFFHNSSTSTIGIIPSSIQNVSGPVGSNPPNCGIAYSPNQNQLPADFKFRFTVATGTDGGSC